ARRVPATVTSLASAISGWMVPAPLADSGNAAAVRETATTLAPASANALAIPFPSPRLAPTTIVPLPVNAFIFVLLAKASGAARVVMGPSLRPGRADSHRR